MLAGFTKNADFQFNPLRTFITFGCKYFISNFKESKILIFMSVSDKILDFVNRYLYLTILLFSTIFFVVLAIVLPIRFEENDDIVMLLFASGDYTGTPEFRLVFINSIFGFLLSGLYSITKGIEWYSFLFSIFQILSLSVILWSIIKHNASFIWKVAFILFFLVLEARFIAQFQFTTTASMLALAGLILFSFNGKARIILGLTLLVISSLVRFEACMLVIILFVPLLLKKYIEEKNYKEIKYISYAIAAISLLYGVNYLTYQTDNEWAAYYQYNKIRGEINDNPNSQRIQNNLPGEVEKIDYELLISFFPDYGKMNLEKIKSIEKSIDDVSFLSKLKNIYPSFRKHTQIILIILFLSLVLCLENKKSNYLFILLSLFMFLFIATFISFSGTLKLRVLLSAVMVLVYSFFILSNNPKPNILVVSAIILMTYLSALFMNRTRNIVINNNSFEATNFQMQKKMVEDYSKKENQILMPIASSLSIQFYPVFNVSKKIKENSISLGGWLTGIPYNNEKVFTHLDLINKNAVFVSNESFNFVAGKLKENYKINYGIDASILIEFENEKYIIFKIVKQ